MPNLLQYLPYIVLLLLSPLIGGKSLRFVYPDIRISVRAKRLAFSTVFGLIAYLPAAFIGLFELAAPFYTPRYALAEWEQNAVFLILSYFGFLVVTSSLVDYVRTRRSKRTVVALPKKVIRFGVQQQIKKVAQVSDAIYQKHEADLARITEELEATADARIKDKKREEISTLLDQLKNIVKADKLAKELERDRAIALLEEELRKRRERQKELEAMAAAGGITPQEAVIDPKEEKVNELLQALKDKLEKQRMLEKAIKSAIESEHITKEDVEYITKELKKARSNEEPAKAKKAPEEGEGAIELAEIEAGERRHDRRVRPSREEDILKSVVADVRAQIRAKRMEKEEEAKNAGERWYEKVQETAPVGARPAGPAHLEELGFGPEERGLQPVELLEEGLEFGELGGAEGGLNEDLLGEFGSELGEIDQNLESEEYDGMFVDVGVERNQCPNCKKKGTTIVYCSNCGKPFCSNCAKNIDAQAEYVEYTCPHCSAISAMKRRQS